MTFIPKALLLVSYGLQTVSIKATLFIASGHFAENWVSKFVLEHPNITCRIITVTEYFGEVLVFISLSLLGAAMSIRKHFPGRYYSWNHAQIWQITVMIILLVVVLHLIFQLAVCKDMCNVLSVNGLSNVAIKIKPNPTDGHCFLPLLEICGCIGILTLIAGSVSQLCVWLIKKWKAKKLKTHSNHLHKLNNHQNNVSSKMSVTEANLENVDSVIAEDYTGEEKLSAPGIFNDPNTDNTKIDVNLSQHIMDKNKSILQQDSGIIANPIIQPIPIPALINVAEIRKNENELDHNETISTKTTSEEEQNNSIDNEQNIPIKVSFLTNIKKFILQQVATITAIVALLFVLFLGYAQASSEGSQWVRIGVKFLHILCCLFPWFIILSEENIMERLERTFNNRKYL